MLPAAISGPALMRAPPVARAAGLSASEEMKAPPLSPTSSTFKLNTKKTRGGTTAAPPHHTCLRPRVRTGRRRCTPADSKLDTPPVLLELSRDTSRRSLVPTNSRAAQDNSRGSLMSLQFNRHPKRHARYTLGFLLFRRVISLRFRL